MKMNSNNGVPKGASGKPNIAADRGQLSQLTTLQRFEKSMVIDFEKWHDGIGYDIEAIKLASPTESVRPLSGC
jgi:hypothetical protein